MPALKALELEGRLAEAAGAPVCVLVGKDDSLRAYCLALLKTAAAPADLPGATVREFEDVPEPHQVFDELRTVPFLGLGGRRVVVVEKGDAFLAGRWQALADYMRKPSDTGMLIICVSALGAKGPPTLGRRTAEAPEEPARPAPKPAKKERQGPSWRDLLKALAAQGFLIGCDVPSWSEAKTWLRSQVQRMGKKVTPRAVDSLMEALGRDVIALRTELEKLSAHAGDDAAIAERDVDELVPQARVRSAFILADAVSRGQAKEALRLCDQLLMRGERMEGIMAVLALQLHRLYQVRALHAAGSSQAEIERALKLKDYMVKQALAALPSTSPERLARQLEILSAADLEAKTTSVRSQEEAVWMENLVARLCAR
jgi:DNA polymerase III delta subunit